MSAHRRERPVRRWVLRTAFAATASTIGLIASGTLLSPASADAPTKVGWWTQGGGHGAPTPDVNSGGMRVAVGPQAGILSYGAVEYSVPSDGTGTLELAITQSTPTPPQPPGGAVTLTPLGNIEACPTKGDSWKEGDNQDIASAPAYDCSTFHFAGAVSADGKTMTFLVDGAADQSPGTMSLAIVPVQTTAVYTVGTDTGNDATPPFFVDFDKPTATSLTLDTSSVASPPPPAYTPPPASSSSGSGAPATTGTTSGGATLSGSTLPTTGSVSTDTTAGQTPVVAGQPQQTQNYTQPVAATQSTGLSENRRDLLLVLLILILFGILYTQNMGGRAPRALAGPRAQQPAGAPVPVPVGDAAHAGTMAAFLPLMPSRGLGRFAKPRTGPARPLT